MTDDTPTGAAEEAVILERQLKHARAAREKLRRVREARELLATARVAFAPRGAGYVTDEATGRRLGDWRSRCETYVQPTATRTVWGESTGLVEVRRTWVLDTLRAEGWDVVEEGEGDVEWALPPAVKTCRRRTMTDDTPTSAAEEAVILERQLEHARAAGNEQLVHLLEDLKLRRARAVAATRIPDPKTQRTYLCDYRSGSELVMIDDRAGGGDFYIGSRPVGDRMLLNAVAICSSGGAAEKAPRLFRAMAWLWDAMGQDVPEVEAEARQDRALLLALVRDSKDGLMPTVRFPLPSSAVLEFAALCHKLVLDGEIVVGDDWRMRIPSPTADPGDLDEWPTTGGGVARRKRADSFRNSIIVYFEPGALGERGDVDAAMRVFHIDWDGEWVVKVDGQIVPRASTPLKTWAEAADRARRWRDARADAELTVKSVITIEPYRGPQAT